MAKKRNTPKKKKAIPRKIAKKTVKKKVNQRRAPKVVYPKITPAAVVNSYIIPKRPDTVPVDQWELPAGYKADGTFASLAQVISDHIPTSSLETLSAQDKKKLVVQRIKLQDNYPTRYMLGVGEVNKDRAISEVQAGTSAGKFIQESEQKVIMMMKDSALKK